MSSFLFQKLCLKLKITSHCGYRVNKPTCFPTKKYSWEFPLKLITKATLGRHGSGVLRKVSPLFTLRLTPVFNMMQLNLRKTCFCASILCVHSLTHSLFNTYRVKESLLGFKQSIRFWGYKPEELIGPGPRITSDCTLKTHSSSGVPGEGENMHGGKRNSFSLREIFQDQRW